MNLETRKELSSSFRISRRQAMKKAAAATVLTTAPLFIPQRAFGANERVITGHIGLGSRGRGNLGAFHENVAALCDLEKLHLDKAQQSLSKLDRRIQSYGNYRELLDRSDIDAVVISTPDHWHALPTIEACRAGKDVYIEKPLSLTIDEGKRMRDAAVDNYRVVQTGAQQRSSGNFRYACELIRQGVIGKVRQVHVGIAAANHPFKDAPRPDGNPPASLDYARWLGPAPYRRYNEQRVHYNFRFFWDFSGGQMTNWGAHHIDIAHWGMGWDATGPRSVTGTAQFHPQGWHDVSETCRIDYQYPDDVVMTVGQQQSDIKMGTRFIGSEGWIYVNRGTLKASDPAILKTEIQTENKLYVSANHYQNFLDCVASREKTISDIAIGHRTATACHLGNLAIRTGKTVRWDADSEQIVGDTELASMQARDYRQPWSLE